MTECILSTRIGIRQVPEISYIIFTTPRSGSTFLCDALDKTGLAGRPGEHFLDWYRTECRPEQIQPMEAPFKMLPPALQMKRVIKRGTRKGIFGVKVMRNYFNFVENSLRRVADLPGLSTRETLEACFPNLHYIYLSRKSKIRQAVSLTRAVQSDEWKRNRWTLLVETFKSAQIEHRNKTVEPLYDFDRILGFYQEMSRQDLEWEKQFQSSAIHPCRVVYEDLLQNLESTVIRILKYVGHDPVQKLKMFNIPLQRQSDEINEEWALRFKRDLARHSKEDNEILDL